MSSVEKTDVAMNPLGSGGLMTGTKMWAQAILEADDSSDFTFGIRIFEAGARTKFHKHTGDQILIITEGTGSVGTDNETLTVVEGDVILIPAGENHFHGAPDATSMGHITIQKQGSVTEQTEA
jgi:quercetin dioxygenase-like cupin family protein|tara:strand:- start:1859 stop:2227 length:369 start_codon:yes stop_codon:yes gene_type:complete